MEVEREDLALSSQSASLLPKGKKKQQVLSMKNILKRPHDGPGFFSGDDSRELLHAAPVFWGSGPWISKDSTPSPLCGIQSCVP